MTKGTDVYIRLSEKIGVVGYPSYIKILENQLTPEEAELTIDLTEGKTPEQMMKKLNIGEKSLSARIEDLVSRRVVLRGAEGRYAIPRTPRFFPRGPDTPKTRELWIDFFYSGDYPKILVAGMESRLAQTGRHTHKIIPAKQALLASPNLKKEDILWYEDMEQIFRRAKTRRQGGLKEDGSLGTREQSGCGCRRNRATCDSPGGCTFWEWQEGEWLTDETVLAERSRTETPGLQQRNITFEEALAACYKMENYGQVHISPNTAQITSTCNCCPCCCVIMYPQLNYGDIHKLLAPSRYRAVIDEELCQGCQTCIERCHFDAIELRKVPASKKMKAFIIEEYCMGCGLCIFKCPNEAMRFEIVRPTEHIPTTPWISPSTYEGATRQTAGRM